MANYALTFARSARKELERLPYASAGRIVKRIERLPVVPRPPGSLKLRGNKNFGRIRVGEFRVLYSIDDGARVIDIVAVRDRRDAYRDV